MYTETLMECIFTFAALNFSCQKAHERSCRGSDHFHFSLPWQLGTQLLLLSFCAHPFAQTNCRCWKLFGPQHIKEMNGERKEVKKESGKQRIATPNRNISVGIRRGPQRTYKYIFSIPKIGRTVVESAMERIGSRLVIGRNCVEF